MKNARRTTLGAAGFVLICFFLPWMQVSCIGLKDSVSGYDMAREGDRALWLLPLLMLAVLLLGGIRLVWERVPAVFTLIGIVAGCLSLWLMARERMNMRNSSGLVEVFWTVWFWMGLIGSFVVAAAALWFYVKRVRAP